MEELLVPRHPLDAQHQAQLQALQAMPEPQRAEMARRFRFGNAAYRYQQQAAGQVTEADYHHWLEGLPAGFRQAMERDGFEKCRTILPLRRHALERRDVGYEAFIQSQLSADDWQAWQDEKAAYQQHSQPGTLLG